MAEQEQSNAFMSEGTRRTRGKDAQRINILIARAVAQAVKSTLGPKGMDKMIVDDLGDVMISNDGAAILGEMAIEHPVGKMLVNVSKTQDEEVGDGTTTVVVLAGTLLEKAEKLLDDSIHPSVIINGYRIAAQKAKEYYAEIAEPVDFKDKKTLEMIALTSMTGKAAEAAEDLAKLIVEAVSSVAETEGGKIIIDHDNIKLEKKTGASLSDTQLVSGIVIDKEIVHTAMPKTVLNAKIALLDIALEVKEPENDAKIEISSPEQLQAFLDQEENMLKDMVAKIKKSGANAIFTQKGIDDLAQHFLAKEKIIAVRRVKKSDVDALARATGASVATSMKELSPKDLGFAGKIYEKKIAGDAMVFVEGCKNPKSVSILIRGGTEHIVDEAERALVDAIGAISATIRQGKVLTGAGSCEMEVAVRLRNFARTVGGREQLAIEAFAEALEIIPRTLAETAGMDPIDSLVSLRSKHAQKGGITVGINVYKAKVEDMKSARVLEPLAVKTQAINAAEEVVGMILRIDDIILGSSKKSPMMPPGGMGGEEGMM
ncbi:MAG: thermosome subunit beta [Candidatus Diapherotrites archaeon]|nr:thermosome subunit beta [Candidatus Diapherotrites archaeon]